MSKYSHLAQFLLNMHKRSCLLRGKLKIFPLNTHVGQEEEQDIPVAKAKRFRSDFAQAPEETGSGSPDTLPDLDFPGDQRREPAPGTSTAGRPRAPIPEAGTSGQGAPIQSPGSGSEGTDTAVPAHGKKLNR